MIKFVKYIPRYLASGQLKAIQQLRAQKGSIQPLDLKQQLWDLAKSATLDDYQQFILIFKEFNYDFREIAELYNNQLDASELVIKKYLENEFQQMINSAYEHQLKMDTSVFELKLDLESIQQYLTENGQQSLMNQTQQNTLKKAYLKVISNTFYGKYNEAIKPYTQTSRFIELIKELEQNILQEIDPIKLISKMYIFCQIQPTNETISFHFAKVIKNAETLTNKEIIVFIGILEKVNKIGNYKLIQQLQRFLNYQVQKNEQQLTLMDKIYILIQNTKSIYLSCLTDVICVQIYNQLHDIDIKYYPKIFQSLSNLYQSKINIIEEEEYINTNLIKFEKIDDLIYLCTGLLYGQSQNIDLITNIFYKLINFSSKQLSNAQKCTIYQIQYILQKLYNKTIQFENEEIYKNIYFNGTNFKAQPTFSQINLEMLETLQNILDELKNEKHSNWKITKIKNNQLIGVFQVNFVIELEGVYKKRLIYIDLIQKNQYIDDNHPNGKLILRMALLKSEDVKFINYLDWYKTENKKQFMIQLLGI